MNGLSAESQLKKIRDLRGEIAEVRADITEALRTARHAKDKKAIRALLELRQRIKTSLIQLRLVERIIRKGRKKG